MKNKVATLVLAGGRGKRMEVLCDLRPKPILPLAGNVRVIDFSLSNCVHSRIPDIGVLVDYERERLADYLIGWNAVNNAARLSILPPTAGSYTGTADAVYQNLDYLEKQNADMVLVLSGDHVYKMDYRPIIAFHQRMGADATLGVFSVPLEETHRFGTVTIDGAGRIKEFREKSSIARSNLASMGIYVFKRDTLAKRLREDAGEPGSLHDFGYNVLPRMVKSDRVFAFEFKGYWLDVGTVKAYYDANMELLPTRPRLSLDGTWPVLSDNTLPPAYSVSQSGRIINSLISPGCVIKGRVENSILSPGIRVAEQALVRNAVIMTDVSIGYHSIVDGCILDERVNIGNYCYVGFGAGLQSKNAEITVLGSDVTVPDRIAIGCQCRVPPGLGPEAFDTRLIPSGTAMAES